MDTGHSFSRLIRKLEEGDDDAYRELFQRFAHRLQALAEKRLEERVKRIVGPDDVVQSAFRSFFIRQADGKLTHENWNTLWGLLVVIVLRKCRQKNDYFHAAIRDVSRDRRDVAFSDGSEFRWEAIDREPTPDEVLQLVESTEKLLGAEDERGQSVLLHRLGNCTELETAEMVGCSVRTVRRIIARARRRLQDELVG